MDKKTKISITVMFIFAIIGEITTINSILELLNLTNIYVEYIIYIIGIYLNIMMLVAVCKTGEK